MAMVMTLTATTDCRQALGHGRRLLVMNLAIVFCTSLLLDGVHCLTTTHAPAPTPTQQPLPFIPIYHQNEADALNTILAKWSTLNPQLSTLLNWTSNVHPCEIHSGVFPKLIDYYSEYKGAWIGVRCTPGLLHLNATGNFSEVSVTSLLLYGSNSSSSEYVPQRGFQGITGELPIEISNLTKLHALELVNNPNVTGPVPIEIFQMPSLQYLRLSNNSFSGTLPSDIYSANCQLTYMDLSYNNFSGNFRVSREGTLFCKHLTSLHVDHNQLDRLLNFENLKNTIYYMSMSNNKLSGPIPNLITFMPSLNSLDLSSNNFHGSIDLQNLTMKSRLMIVNISCNNLNGTFFTGSNFDTITLDVSNNYLKNITFDVFNSSSPNKSLSYMPSLKQLYMQNNSLKGTFPSQILTSLKLKNVNFDQNQYEILELPDLQFDRFNFSRVFLTNNNFKYVQYARTGPLSSRNVGLYNLLFLGGNPYCNRVENVLLSIVCRFNESSPFHDVIPKSFTKNKIIIATTISVSFMFLLLVGAIYVWRLMRRIKSLQIILKEFGKNEVKPNLYSYKKIKLATNNFNKNNKLGEGGFGVVYKGELNDHTVVAVKKLNTSSHQVLSEFLHEVVIIAGLKHRNLVKLRGCCLGDGDQLMLVFEYMENKNLGEALWPHDNFGCLGDSPIKTWDTRFNIILGIARGLAYLHEDLQSPIIHRDIKATNILLDKDYNPKIADFGLAYLYPTLENEASHLTLMQVAGTRGYCSPEYALHGHISTSIDVYSFGIVALEVVSGRKNIDYQRPEDEINLREWAWKQYEGQTTMALVDPKIKHSPMDVEAMIRVTSIALMCVHYKATKRPKMHDVVSMLCGKTIIGDFSSGFEYGDEDVISNFRMASGSTSLCARNSLE